MEQRKETLLFALLRSAISGTELTSDELILYSDEMMPEIMELAQKHDLAHLVAVGLKQNRLVPVNNAEIRNVILKAVLRYERLNADYEKICKALETAEIPFIPLKGSVLRKFYPEEWMRTSCDIDILVHREELNAAVAYLVSNLNFKEDYHGSHDITLIAPKGTHLELHFDLIEEGLSNEAARYLRTVWEYVSPRAGTNYWYEMPDAFFYFYHIAHMAKHFEHGGCGIRPFIDLYVLKNMAGADRSSRDTLLEKSGLLRFSRAVENLSDVWFGCSQANETSSMIQAYILGGGTYGSLKNYVAVRQEKQGGRIGYIWSRVFMPYSELKRGYPILKKHRWLMPFCQLLRWVKLIRPAPLRKAVKEIEFNHRSQSDEADAMSAMLKEIGL